MKQQNRYKLSISIFTSRILLDLVYAMYIVPIWGYSGFRSSISLSIYFISWLVLICLLPVVLYAHKTIFESLSRVIILSIYFISIIPFTTMMGFGNFSISYILYSSFYWFFLLYLYWVSLSIKLRPRFLQANSDLPVIYEFLIFSIIIFVISYKYVGLRIDLSIFNVYERRTAVTKFDLPTIIKYMFSASRSVLPIILVFFYIRKRKWLFIFSILVQVLSFSFDGMKTVIFITIFSVIICFYYKDIHTSYLFKLFPIIPLFALLESLVVRTVFITGLIIRRVLFLPTLLQFYYYNFLIGEEPNLYRDFFGRIFGISGSKPINISHTIGEVFFNAPDMGANSGFIADAVYNWGQLGPMIMPVILIIFFRILDMVSYGLNIKLLIIISILIPVFLSNTFLSTALLSHGLFAVIMTLFIFPRKK